MGFGNHVSSARSAVFPCGRGRKASGTCCFGFGGFLGRPFGLGAGLPSFGGCAFAASGIGCNGRDSGSVVCPTFGGGAFAASWTGCNGRGSGSVGGCSRLCFGMFCPCPGGLEVDPAFGGATAVGRPRLTVCMVSSSGVGQPIPCSWPHLKPPGGLRSWCPDFRWTRRDCWQSTH